MGYVYLLCVAMMFSFGGTCVKLISPWFGADYISFFRFLVGVLCLLVLKLVKRQKFPANFGQLLKMCAVWIVFGAASKWLSYLTENYALTLGPSYGNIVTQPAQTIFITLLSVFLFKDKLSLKKGVCIALCILGVLCISWNGYPLEAFLNQNIFLTALYVLSGICAGCHVLAQKKIVDKMDDVDSNLSIFTVAAVLAAMPLAPKVAGGELAGGRPDVLCIIAILAFGFTTGIGFYLNAKAIALVPFYMVPIVQSTQVIFAIVWGALFWGESITVYVVTGTVLFMAGLLGLEMKLPGRKTEA